MLSDLKGGDHKMTRRERREARLEKRRLWAEKAKQEKQESWVGERSRLPKVLEAWPGPVCGHSACRQHWIDSGESDCTLPTVG